MPLAPERIEVCIALRMARRNCTRPESCSATPWATSCASISGFFTSRMFSWTCLPVSFSSSPRRRSASAPRRPITMPGRAVWMSTRTRSRVRSISTLEMPARSMPLDSSLRIATSSPTYDLYSLSAYHRLLWSVEMPRRKPLGLIFCPIRHSFRSSWLSSWLGLGGVGQGLDGQGDVAGPLEDARRPALGAGAPALHRRALVDQGHGDDQVAAVEVLGGLGVGDGALEHLVDRRGRRLRREGEQVQARRPRAGRGPC